MPPVREGCWVLTADERGWHRVSRVRWLEAEDGQGYGLTLDDLMLGGGADFRTPTNAPPRQASCVECVG